ncbi:MAG: hypothetical protein LQ345_005723, partial [Seirophora villosa]
ACDSDEDLPGPEHLLVHLTPQRPAAINPSRATGPTLGPAPPPTPMTTPIKPRQHQALGHARSPRPTAPTATTLTLNFKPTSETTPPRTEKRPIDSISASTDDEQIITPSKRIRSRRITTAPPTAIPSPPPTPVSIDKKSKISSFEINRVRACVMKKVNWKKVAKEVACNRSAGVYQRGVKGVFDAWMEETVAEEGKGK